MTLALTWYFFSNVAEILSAVRREKQTKQSPGLTQLRALTPARVDERRESLVFYDLIVGLTTMEEKLVEVERLGGETEMSLPRVDSKDGLRPRSAAVAVCNELCFVDDSDVVPSVGVEHLYGRRRNTGGKALRCSLLPSANCKQPQHR